MPILCHPQRWLCAACLLWTSVSALPAADRAPDAGAPPPLRLVLENHRFTPQELHARAGQPIVILLENRDPTPEEWESLRLRKEFGLRGHQSGRIVIKPQQPGRYTFRGEFNADTAIGYLIVE